MFDRLVNYNYKIINVMKKEIRPIGYKLNILILATVKCVL